MLFKSSKDWNAYCKSGKKLDDIPSSPIKTYKAQWKGMGNWLGTEYIANADRHYIAYDYAKEFVHKLGLNNFSNTILNKAVWYFELGTC
jgi:hypothetical protein